MDTAKANELVPTPAPRVLIGDKAAQSTRGGLSMETLPGGRILHKGSVDDLLASACKAKLDGYVSEGRDSWCGCSFDTALHLALTGWHDAVPLVEDLFARIQSAKTESILPEPVLTDEPDGDVDVDRWLEGEDECYIRTEQRNGFRIEHADTFVRFVLDPFASWNVATADVLRRGVYLAGLVYLFARSGYTVAVMLRMPTNGSGKEWLLECTLQDYGDTLDLPRLMFWLAHPSVLRHLIIGAYRPHRSDAIYPDRFPIPEEQQRTTITAPGINDGDGLDEWLQGILKANNLTLEG